MKKYFLVFFAIVMIGILIGCKRGTTTTNPDRENNASHHISSVQHDNETVSQHPSSSHSIIPDHGVTS